VVGNRPFFDFFLFLFYYFYFIFGWLYTTSKYENNILDRENRREFYNISKQKKRSLCIIHRYGKIRDGKSIHTKIHKNFENAMCIFFVALLSFSFYILICYRPSYKKVVSAKKT